MNRQQLKDLVKECLVELLTEGIGNLGTSVGKPIVAQESFRRPVQRQTRVSPLDIPIGKRQSPSTALQEAIRVESRGNSVMADILADTAARTLPNMLAHGDVGTGNGNIPTQVGGQQEKFAGTPEQAFGEDTASKWAALAFSVPSSKKTA